MFNFVVIHAIWNKKKSSVIIKAKAMVHFEIWMANKMIAIYRRENFKHQSVSQEFLFHKEHQSVFFTRLFFAFDLNLLQIYL